MQGKYRSPRAVGVGRVLLTVVVHPGRAPAPCAAGVPGTSPPARGTPTLMLADGSKLRSPIAFPQMREHRISGVVPLPCHADECLQATRELFERALTVGPART